MARPKKDKSYSAFFQIDIVLIGAIPHDVFNRLRRKNRLAVKHPFSCGYKLYKPNDPYPVDDYAGLKTPYAIANKAKRAIIFGFKFHEEAKQLTIPYELI